MTEKLMPNRPDENVNLAYDDGANNGAPDGEDRPLTLAYLQAHPVWQFMLKRFEADQIAAHGPSLQEIEAYQALRSIEYALSNWVKFDENGRRIGWSQAVHRPKSDGWQPYTEPLTRSNGKRKDHNASDDSGTSFITKGGDQHIRPSFVSGTETVKELEEMLETAVKEDRKEMAGSLRAWIKVVKSSAKYANKFGKGPGGKPPRVGTIDSDGLASAGISAIIVAGVAIYYNTNVEKIGEAAEHKIEGVELGRLIRVMLHDDEVPEVYDKYGNVLQDSFLFVYRGKLMKVVLERLHDGIPYIVILDMDPTGIKTFLPYGKVPLSGG